eukprot:TRINITY_DN39581_c0_g2_i1.p1 TRINITY_DN39581_c0_g2~~TRINITY_DN39581_c0_g2_i1.p1  ORF type:complete len:415 (+),score=49.06 TRINITY_DN39581_c0_g2_i1:137-1246(+)
MATGVNPVFVKSKDIPDSANKRPMVLEMCLAAEKSGGQGSVVGAQQIHGLWRIYPATTGARSQLLIQGMTVRGVVIQLSNTNPFILRSDSGQEKPSTKVWVDNVPISVADTEIEHALVKVGCELRSTVKADRARDMDNKLTRFLTGRRFVFITVPSVPLEKTLKINLFTASIYHREQRQVSKKPVICSRCLEENHHASMCQKDIVCRECGQEGHKRGDPACQFSVTVTPDANRETDADRENTSGNGEATQSAERTDDSRREQQERHSRGRTGERQTTIVPSTQLRNQPRQPRNDRSRPLSRQPTILSSLERSPRDRSATPKRRRSRQRHSPGQGMEKQQRRDDTWTDSSATNNTDRPDPTPVQLISDNN